MGEISRHDSGIARAAVIGAGTMGRGIAAVLTRAGVAVAIHDRSPSARASAVIHAARHGNGDLLFARDEVGNAVASSELIVEAVDENLELKRDVIAQVLDAAPADAIIASNTSTLDIDALADGSPRVIGVHWFNPPELIPGVEVVPGRDTAPAIVDRVVMLLRALGKEPVVVANVPGFVANRLQEALVAEAVRCVAAGHVTPADVDTIVRSTFGPRLAVLGPFEVIDEGGLEVERRALEVLRAAPGGEAYAVPPLLDELVAAGRTGTAVGAGVYRYNGDAAAVTERRRRRLREAFALARRAAINDGQKETGRMDENIAGDGGADGSAQRAVIRLRFGPADARYGDGLIDGSRLLQLFGDLATELSILLDGDEGLFRAYESVDFLAPVRVGEFVEAEAWVLRMGRTSRRFGFEARRRIAPAPHHGPTAAEVLGAPEVVARATGTIVVPAERQRPRSAPEPNARPVHGPEEGR